MWHWAMGMGWGGLHVIFPLVSEARGMCLQVSVGVAHKEVASEAGGRTVQQVQRVTAVTASGRRVACVGVGRGYRASVRGKCAVPRGARRCVRGVECVVVRVCVAQAAAARARQ